MINRGGVNVYPAEIEAALMRMGPVRESAVVGAPSTRHGEIVVAFIVADEVIAEDVLEQHCRRQLAPYKVPARYAFLDRLPKKSSGKTDKAALLELLDKK